MLKKLLFLAVCACSVGYAFASRELCCCKDVEPTCCECKNTCDCCEHRCNNWQIMFKNGYFVPSDKHLRCMFKGDGCRSGGYYLEGALRYRLCRGLFAELVGSWFKKEGRSLLTTVYTSANATTDQAVCCAQQYGECFTLKLPTFGFGLKYFYDFCHDCLNVFAGAGLKAYFTRMNIACNYPGCCTCECDNSIGGYVGAGMQYKPFCGFILEAFVDYLTKTASSKKSSSCCSYNYCLDVSGVVAGLGIGYQF